MSINAKEMPLNDFGITKTVCLTMSNAIIHFLLLYASLYLVAKCAKPDKLK